MFGARKGGIEGEPNQDNLGRVEARSDNLSASTPRTETSVAAPRMALTAPARGPDRLDAMPTASRPARRSSHTASHDLDSRTSSDGARTLKVGKGLSVAGEITSCDVLVVEGKVEAKLNDGKMLEITESGQFRGSVEIENADIAGRYDGQIIVHGRLTIRSTGRVSGMIKYGELEVNAGGQVIGEVQVAGAASATVGAASKGGVKFTPYEEAEEETAADRVSRSERRTA